MSKQIIQELMGPIEDKILDMVTAKLSEHYDHKHYVYPRTTQQ